MVVHTCSPSIPVAEAGESRVQPKMQKMSFVHKYMDLMITVSGGVAPPSWLRVSSSQMGLALFPHLLFCFLFSSWLFDLTF
jgi:hypothetical protein